MSWSSKRQFNYHADPYWRTPEGEAELGGGYATFDHHLGGGTREQAIEAARREVELTKPAGRKASYDNAMAKLADPTGGTIEFEHWQDRYLISETNDPNDCKPGVRNFEDRRVRENLEVGFDEKGRIVRADGMVRKGWRWVKP